MSKTRQKLGRWGESLAAKYLEAKEYTIVARNVRTRYGEIDLVARQEVEAGKRNQCVATTVFVEVKTRSTSTFGYPEESITVRKRAHMVAAAQAYLQEHAELEGDWRIDVIAIQRLPSGKQPSIMHFENAVQE
jgi:putative endonuclease